MISDSRSQSSVGSNPEAQLQSNLSHLTDAQLHNLSNPVFIKFLMSQRNQSDLSSVGGFSNVETGSQVIVYEVPDVTEEPVRQGSQTCGSQVIAYQVLYVTKKPSRLVFCWKVL